MERNIVFADTKTVVIKTNNKCNLCCSYCYDEMNQTGSSKRISEEHSSDILKTLATNAKKNGVNHLNIIWHGGEPLLMGVDFYLKMISIQSQLNFSFSNLLQTNATLITDEWIRLFINNQFKIGVSYDGSLKANSVHREKSEVVEKNILRLCRSGIRPSIICVVSDENCMHIDDMFSFTSSISAEYVDFVPCYENNGRFTLSSDNYVMFMRTLFDYWWDSGCNANYRFFNNILSRIYGINRSDEYVSCSLSGRCGEIISVNADGVVYFCDCFPKEPQYAVGNSIEECLESSSRNYNRLKSLNAHTPDSCCKCDYLGICGKGCLNRRINTKGERELLDYYCEARKMLFKHIEARLQKKIQASMPIGIPAFTRGPQPIMVN